jgi:redox-sensitive bicupin YhaK (pirin superfamily)
LYCIAGEFLVDDHKVMPQMIAEMDKENTALSLQTLTESHLMVLGGSPLNEPIVGYASYVMNDQAQIMQVMRDYEMGHMGFLEY